MTNRALTGALFGVAIAVAGCGEPRGSDQCVVGSRACSCTPGGGCDPGLSCIEGTCQSGNASADSGLPTTTTTTTSESQGESGVLDVGGGETVGGNCNVMGCRQVDVLFAIDSSLSMIEEINALSSTQAFTRIVQTLADLNCGDIEYRIGLTNDNDGGFIGSGGTPWFDSADMTADQIATAFNAAASTVLGNGGTPVACEHVLSSASAMLVGDTTAFLRPNALLVLVLITDVDDYGFYDQQGFGGPCDSFLCTQVPLPVSTLYGNLLTLKGGDPQALSTIVLAGDPAVQEGVNNCQQPASCCGVGGIECGQAHHAPRLWDFASMQAPGNGVTVDICDGADQIPTAIEAALTGDIDLACQTFEPAG